MIAVASALDVCSLCALILHTSNYWDHRAVYPGAWSLSCIFRCSLLGAWSHGRLACGFWRPMRVYTVSQCASIPPVNRVTLCLIGIFPYADVKSAWKNFSVYMHLPCHLLFLMVCILLATRPRIASIRWYVPVIVCVSFINFILELFKNHQVYSSSFFRPF